MKNETIPLSKKTTALQAEVRTLKGELSALRPSVDKLLSDDSGSVNKLATELSGVRAKAEILEGRIARRKAELYKALCDDAEGVLTAAQKRYAECREAWEQAKENWRHELIQEHGGAIAKDVLHNPVLMPRTLRDCKAGMREALNLIGSAQRILGQISKDYRVRNCEQLCPDTRGKSRIWPMSELIANAAKFCPELAD